MAAALLNLRAWAKHKAKEVQETLNHNGPSAVDFDWRTVVLFALISLLLTLYYYYVRPTFFRRHFLSEVSALLGLEGSSYKDLLSYWYWALGSIVVRVMMPLGLIVLWLKESPKDYGFRLWKRGHGKVYLAFYALIFPVLFAVSTTPSFQDKYPFYAGADDSATHFLLYELAYGIQFASLEAFFRGFMTFVLFKKFGYYAVMIMTIPYCMIHFNKPVVETLGAIAAGMLLGYMAIASRSWIPGALLHWGVGITMDLMCVLQRGGFGK